MTGQLSELQRTWLRGLKIAGGWTTMSASELGNTEVSELQSLGLVAIRHTTFAGVEWLITDAGKAHVNPETGNGEEASKSDGL